jgi:hypothetical protein
MPLSKACVTFSTNETAYRDIPFATKLKAVYTPPVTVKNPASASIVAKLVNPVIPSSVATTRGEGIDLCKCPFGEHGRSQY